MTNEKICKIASELIDYKIEYIPGVTENQDMYEAKCLLFGTSNFGSTKEKALESAKKNAEAEFIGEFSLAREIVKKALQKYESKKARK